MPRSALKRANFCCRRTRAKSPSDRVHSLEDYIQYTSALPPHAAFMMSYELCIAFWGEGTDPEDPVHWGMMIFPEGRDRGDLMHTILAILRAKSFMYNEETGRTNFSTDGKGRVRIALLDEEQRGLVKNFAREVAAPNDGVKNCQDWVVDVVVLLEAEGLVTAGIAARLRRLVAKPASEIGEILGEDWMAVRPPGPLFARVHH